MAAPVKNFTNPTGITLMSSAQFPTIIPNQFLMFYKTGSWIMNNFYDPRTLVMTSKNAMSNMTNVNYFPKLPPPPLGRVLVTTFPPIYKSKVPIVAGQLYPRYM